MGNSKAARRLLRAAIAHPSVRHLAFVCRGWIQQEEDSEEEDEMTGCRSGGSDLGAPPAAGERQLEVDLDANLLGPQGELLLDWLEAHLGPSTLHQVGMHGQIPVEKGRLLRFDASLAGGKC